ncbi:MAG: alpha/beta hydrolase [Patescibacteria group bacterium]
MKKIATIMTVLFVAIAVFATVSIAAGPTVVILGGVGGAAEHYLELQENIPGSVVIVPKNLWPLYSAADDLLQQIREEGISGQVIFVAHSWGGIIARKIDAENPGVVAMIITIATPSGGFGPDFIKFFFDAGDKNSDTPLYAIVGFNSTIPKKMYMEEGEENDGVVTLKSALDFRGKKVSELRVLEGLEHTEMLKSQEVIQLVKSWVQNYRGPANQSRVFFMV